MNSPSVVLFHTFVFCIILYLIMTMLLKQQHNVALNRTLIIGAIFVVYTTLYGYNLPGGDINPGLFA